MERNFHSLDWLSWPPSAWHEFLDINSLFSEQFPFLVYLSAQLLFCVMWCFSPLFLRFLRFCVVHVCSIVADLMYITRGQVALYRARLDLLSMRTSPIHSYSYSLPRALALKCVVNYLTITSLALVAIVITLAIATGLVPSLVLRNYPCSMKV